MRYTPHRGSFSESQKEMKVYDTIEALKKDISNEYYNESDIVIKAELRYDKRVDYNKSMVCVKRFGNEVYKTPQCIGYVERE